MRSLLITFMLTSAILPGLCGCGNGNKSTQTQQGIDMSGSRQGHGVAFADFDGDGMDDKLVGAPYIKTGSGRFGAVLVYRGADPGFESVPSSALDGGDNFGYAVVNTGDVDGDGTDDFAVGAIHGNGEDVSLSGSVTVYKGGANGEIIKKLSGEWPMDKFGFSVAGGDLNGDGYSDLVVGAPFNTNIPSLYQAGAVYVFFGPDLVSKTSLYATSTIKGLGWAVATGDINGDTRADLLIATSKTDANWVTTYSVLGFYGVPDGTSYAPSMTAPDVAISGAASGFGKAVAVVENIDGTGGNEIAIGAPNALLTLAGIPSRDVGSVYLVSIASGTAIDTSAETPPAGLLARLDGETLFSRFGSSITTAGADIAVGAPMADVDWTSLSGKVYLFKATDIAAGDSWSNAGVFSGMVKNQGYGASLAFGSSALLIGAPRSTADTGGSAMVDPATGLPVPGGSSGGSSGSNGECH